MGKEGKSKLCAPQAPKVIAIVVNLMLGAIWVFPLTIRSGVLDYILYVHIYGTIKPFKKRINDSSHERLLK